MNPRKPSVDLNDLSLLSAEPSLDSLARAKKLRALLETRTALWDGIINNWSERLGVPGANDEASTKSHAEKNKSSTSDDPLDGTIEPLVRAYRTLPASRYHKLKFRSRISQDNLLKFLVEELRGRQIDSFTKAEISALHKKWSVRGDSMAYAIATQLRTLVNFGARELDDKRCLNLSFILRSLRIEIKPATKRTARPISEDEAKALIDMANKMGLHSIALAQAFQYDCKLGQVEVIGDWVPSSEPGVSAITDTNGTKWLRGLRWNEIDENLILNHTVSDERRAPFAIRMDLKERPLVREQLRLTKERLKELPRSGPVVVNEQTFLPWTAPYFRWKWRDIARKLKMDDDVKNMDIVAGAHKAHSNETAKRPRDRSAER